MKYVIAYIVYDAEGKVVPLHNDVTGAKISKRTGSTFAANMQEALSIIINEQLRGLKIEAVNIHVIPS